MQVMQVVQVEEQSDEIPLIGIVQVTFPENAEC